MSRIWNMQPDWNPLATILTPIFRQETTESSPEYLKMADFDLSQHPKINWVTVFQRSMFPFFETKFKVHVNDPPNLLASQPVRYGLASVPFQNNEGLVGPWLIHHPTCWLRNGDRWPVLSNEALCSEANEGLGSPQHRKTINSINWKLTIKMKEGNLD